ncbi:hypothetical protein [Streptomyces hygroscopicus]|uniref:hypothetical protein n=1 Tax=Streptomyces hygroscopicus TaxID=1912 RepID=UPI001FCB3818|nr:hypothetical protein [Streptomyces hygroscopicus]BDH15385.1 hypothetical protein HOK021_65640 [Streptomyces hygroscopicus]
MFEKIRRALKGAALQPGTASAGPSTRPVYHWRCACGAHSRGGDPFKSDAEDNAQRHMWRKGKGHPMPEVYLTEEELA